MYIQESKFAQMCWEFLGFGIHLHFVLDIIQGKGIVFSSYEVNDQLKFFKVMLC